MKGIQHYIAYMTKIWLEWPGIEYLKKTEEQENRFDFLHNYSYSNNIRISSRK